MAEPFCIEEATISSIHEAVRQKRLTFVELTRSYLDRIEQFDKPSGLNSIILVNPNALERAKELDEAFLATGRLAPLAGIPVVVKDNFHTAGLQTTAGSIAMKGFVPEDNAFQIRQVIEAGAIILCKANMCEWAFHWGHSSSSILGETRNPYDLSRTVAGSSGGTAAAVAANLGAVGLGTDTGNSIRGPSSHAALVGIRSTIGATSRQGIIPLFDRNDIGGPMCRTVEDAARLFGIIAGPDTADPITEHGRAHVISDYTQFLHVGGLKGARVGVFRLLSEKDDDLVNSPVKPLFENAIADMKRLGATIIDPVPVPRYHELREGVWAYPAPFLHDINAYFAALGSLAPYKTLHEILDAGLCDPRIKAQAEMQHGCNDAKALNHPEENGFFDAFSDPRRCAFRDAVVAAMDEHEVDVLIYPTWNDPPTRIGETRPSSAGNNSGAVAPPTGLPALTVPMGYTGPDKNWPAGLQMLGRMFAETTLFRLAFAYEQGTKHRKPPACFIGSGPSMVSEPVINAMTVAAGDVPPDRGCF
eukprot:TRINITY_DN40793_c0_g1_i1.p1 TRINITY_DN40793_c0_g1~~TRINITY_DN40793_c0_g1_i1.p1  ORF type:complete len:549 (-),score=55.68 TRINITY_DN40793_c0_g1_i1:99-1691(-)